MTRETYVVSSLVVATAGAGATALAALGPWPEALAIAGRDTWRTAAVALVLALAFAWLHDLAAARLRATGASLAPARAAYVRSVPLPLGLLAYKAAYPVLPYAGLWAAAWLVGALAALAVLAWTLAFVRVSRA